jgi:hypothetical protein
MPWRPLERFGGQHLVKEPTELGGTGRYSCDLESALTCEGAGQSGALGFPYKEEVGGSKPSAPTINPKVRVLSLRYMRAGS